MNSTSLSYCPITVLMPNYNNAPFLKEAIDSVLNQTFKNFVFLIIDDGSTDSSIEIIKSYNDPRIQLIEKDKNSGIVDTLNIGLRSTNTKYAIRMDGDDISTPTRFETLYHFMENNPKIGVCGSEIQTFGDTHDLWKYSTDGDKIKARLIFNAGVGHASCIYRMSVFKEHSIYYSSKHPYMEDFDLFSRIKNVTEFGNIPTPLYNYRILKHNSTVKNRDTIFERYRNIYKDVLVELSIEPTKENVEKHFDFFINPDLSFKLSVYKNWLDLLISQNKKTNIYPQKALEEILAERWDIFFFKIAPLSIKRNLEYFLVSKKMDLKKLIYLVKLKINRLLNKKNY